MAVVEKNAIATNSNTETVFMFRRVADFQVAVGVKGLSWWKFLRTADGELKETVIDGVYLSGATAPPSRKPGRERVCLFSRDHAKNRRTIHDGRRAGWFTRVEKTENFFNIRAFIHESAQELLLHSN